MLRSCHQTYNLSKKHSAGLSAKSWAKAARSRKAGADHVILHKSEDIAARVREITDGRGVPAVFDSVGQDTVEGSLRCLSPRGMLVSFGTASGPIPPFDLFRLNQMGSLYVTSPGYVAHTQEREELMWRASDVFAALAAGTLRQAAPRVYPLAEAAQAHRDLQGRAVLGVAVLRPE